MSKYFSQAGNFANAVEGNVDPRTGLFSASIKIADIKSNDLRGPELPLTLNYTPFSNHNYGLGIGWSFNWSVYDTTSHTLFASTGEQFKTAGVNNQLVQQKLKTIHFLKDARTDYRLFHRSGVVEVLKGEGNAFPVKVPDTIYSPSGLKLNLIWTSDYSSEYWIKRIEDGTGNILIDIDYSHSNTPVITIWPGTNDAYSIHLLLTEKKMISMINDDSRWIFSYDSQVSAGNFILNNIIYPGGLTETVYYQKNGHKFPAAHSELSLPYVWKYIKSPQGEQPELIYQYAFSEKNFLGYQSGLTCFNPDEDNLFNCPQNDYKYSSTLTLISNGQASVITQRTYNKYHLMISEVINQKDCRQRKDIEYYAEESLSWQQQSDIYQFPKKVTTRYSSDKNNGAFRDEQVITNYDSRGNITYKQEPDGTVRVWSYYPDEGETGKCPLNPNPFTGVLFCKTETTTPPASDFSTPILQKQYTYTAISRADSHAPFPHFIVPSEVKTYVGNTLISTLNTTYINQPGERDHGRIQAVTKTYYDDERQSYSGKTEYNYEHDNTAGTLKIARTFTSFDGLTSTLSETLSTRSGLTLLNEDQMGVKACYTYDRFGRQLTKTAAWNSPYAQLTTTEYQFVPLNPGDSTLIQQVTVTNHRGERNRIWYDGANHIIKHEGFCDTTGQWYPGSSCQYNDKWQQVSKTHADVIFSTTEPTTVTKETYYSYDNWGNLSCSRFSEGGEKSSDFDPVSLIQTDRWNSSGATKQTQYDVKHLPLTVTTTDQDGATTITHSAYDGLGRLRSFTNEAGATTNYEYDNWNRICRTAYADGAIVTKTYAPQGSSPSLVNSIAVNNLNIGRQTFDGFQRQESITCGGRTIHYRYKNAFTSPRTVMWPDGTALSRNLIPELGLQQKACIGDTVTQNFTYDSTGALISAIENGAEEATIIKRQYNHRGLLVEESIQQGDENEPRKTQNSYTFWGLPVSYTDSGQQQNMIQYDQFGRPSKVRYGEMEAVLKYDRDSHFTGWTCGVLDVELTFDSLDREIQRTLTNSADRTTLTIRQKFTATHLLKERSTDFIRLNAFGKPAYAGHMNEKYRYDQRNRLVNYDCQGDLVPQDNYGNRIRQQSFSYDALSNITRVITYFSDTQDIAICHYENLDDPCQLTRITHTGKNYPPEVRLAYNANGQMTRDETGAHLEYDDMGRLAKIVTRDGVCYYGYDALNRLTSQTDTRRRQFYYQGKKLVNYLEKTGDEENITRWLRIFGNVTAESRRRGQSSLFSCDDKASTLAIYDGISSRYMAYAPYGEQPPLSGQANKPGYNGERFDAISRSYHLGNGYRIYQPSLMRFTSPDSLSPFSAGGINPYAYCAGDPINGSDPSGHFNWALFGEIIGGVAAVASIVGGLVGAAFALPALTAAETLGETIFSGARVLSGGVTAITTAGATATGIASTEVKKQARSLDIRTKNNGELHYDNGKASTAKSLYIASVTLGAIAALSGLTQITTEIGARKFGWFQPTVSDPIEPSDVNADPPAKPARGRMRPQPDTAARPDPTAEHSHANPALHETPILEGSVHSLNSSVENVTIPDEIQQGRPRSTSFPGRYRDGYVRRLIDHFEENDLVNTLDQPVSLRL